MRCEVCDSFINPYREHLKWFILILRRKIRSEFSRWAYDFELTGVCTVASRPQPIAVEPDPIIPPPPFAPPDCEQIFRLCSNRDRLLIFRGWSRLCFHAASLSAAEGASAAKTASARASRADAMEKEAAAAAIKAEAWKRAAAASAEVAAAKEQAQRQVTGVPTLADDLQRQVKDSEEVAREQKKRRARLLVRDGRLSGSILCIYFPVVEFDISKY